MRAIVLHTARVDNAGNRRAAGETIVIGTEPDQLDADTAALLESHGLASAPSAAYPVPPAEPAAD